MLHEVVESHPCAQTRNDLALGFSYLRVKKKQHFLLFLEVSV